MKTALLAFGVLVLMAASGGAGYYFGTDNGLKQAQTIRNEFFQQRAGNFGNAPTGDSASSAQGQGQRSAGQGQAQAQGQGQFAAVGGRPVAQGTIKSVEGNKITVTQQDGTTATITIDDKTTVQKQVNGVIADLTTGVRVIVTEQGNTRRIQIVAAQ